MMMTLFELLHLDIVRSIFFRQCSKESAKTDMVLNYVNELAWWSHQRIIPKLCHMPFLYCTTIVSHYNNIIYIGH